MRRGVFAGLGSVLVALVTSATAASCGSDGPSGLASNCSINSDCDSPLICAFGLCHEACTESRDCPAGEECVYEGSVGVCQLPAEKSCSVKSPCATGLTCATDSTCHNSCVPGTSGGCQGSQICSTIHSEAAGEGVCYDSYSLSDSGATTSVDSGTGGHDSSAPPTDTGAADGARDAGPHDATTSTDATLESGAHDAGTDTYVDPCTNNPETLFGSVVNGDSNPHFTSGVGLRTPTQMLLFNGYAGPNPGGFDAGPDAGGVGLVYAQAFDATTGAMQGASAPLFQVPYGSQVTVEDVAISPSGQIALLVGIGTETFGYEQTNATGVTQLFAAFLEANPDAGGGAVRLSVTQLVQVETYAVYGQPHALWSASGNVFVFSWEYANGGAYLAKVRRFLPSGAGAGGDTDAVPTQYGTDQVAEGWYDTAVVGASGDLLGVAYRKGSYVPALTLLDVHGNEVASPLEGLNYDLAGGGTSYVAIGGSSAGFVMAYENGSGVTGEFISTAADGGFLTDAGDGGHLARFTFPGAQVSLEGRAVNDSPGASGGGGGVGMATLYPDGVSFTYFSATGSIISGPGQVIAHSHAAGDEVTLSNFGGSFGVALYSASGHSTQMAASGCAQ